MARSDAADPQGINRTGARPDDHDVQDDQDDHPWEERNVRAGATSVFDRLGGPAIYRQLGRERSVDKPEEGSHSRSRLDHLQRQLDQLVG